MGIEIGESSDAGCPDSIREDAGTGSSVRRRFPLAAQPEIMRAAQKDDQYASYVYEACRDTFRHLFGGVFAYCLESGSVNACIWNMGDP
ncbi:hypothetical protein E3N88_43014 [Mikania micrantha]|uniref:Uncharacterized protein n=1 Tax=Mikania micrantha TaxID=192012 RepID=A0A5N6LG28_9ASTR|nr:hypothetical protein E3N88_43014 [Mikania micrantha]